MNNAKKAVQLTLPLEMPLLPLTTCFCENAARVLGLDANDALKLTLAAEEVFCYLAGRARPGETITLETLGGGYYVEVKFLFPSQDVDLSIFNLTSSVSLEDEAQLEKLGLLLASRLVEHLSILSEENGEIGLLFRKEKSYPVSSQVQPLDAAPLTDYQIIEPGPEQIKELSRLISANYQPHEYPPSFSIPGKLVDMVAGGEYGVLATVGDRGAPGGCMLWRWRGWRSLRSYGPYLFNQPAESDMAEKLVEAVLARLGKSDAMGFIVSYPTAELPLSHFEVLGNVGYQAPDGSIKDWLYYYRQMQEDPGARVWAHPELKDFLTAEYQRLVLAREVRLSQPQGEALQRRSVLAAHVDRIQGYVTLHPIWDGADLDANLRNHVQVLRDDGLPNIVFAMDLGQPWQTRFTPNLLENGFTPQLIIPFGGRGDVVVFVHENGLG